MYKKPQVSVIIVYNLAKTELFNCISSIKTKIPHEIIVVDNDIPKRIGPELKKKFPKVKYIKTSGNIGYGAGMNLGTKKAAGEFLFILNPDTIVFPGTIEKLVDKLKKDKNAGLVAPELLDANKKVYEFVGTGELNPISAVFSLSLIHKLFPNNPIAKKYWIKRTRQKIKRVNVVPGTAFLVRKKLFFDIGGFDEKFFIYFEECDLSKRVEKLNLKNYVLNNAPIIHLWAKSTPNEAKRKNWFLNSRKYYFEKHFGKFSANLVSIFLEFGKKQLIFVSIVTLSIFLRFYRISENLVFSGEQGDNYLAIKNFLLTRQIPLLGPPTSHPWLSFGPLFYWLFAPILKIFNFQPIAGSYFFAIVGCLLIIFNYFFIKKIFNSKIALLSSFFITVSPAFVDITRQSRFFSLVIILFYPFYYFFIKSIRGSRKYLFWLGLTFGISLNFHYTPLIFLPICVYYFWKSRSKFLIKDYLKVFIGFIIPTIPLILYNVKTNFQMLGQFSIWIPYRILGFTGIYHKNTLDLYTFFQNIFALINFISYDFIPKFGAYSIPFTIFFLAIVLYLFISKHTLEEEILILFLLVGYFALFVHGDPPPHYFYPILVVPVILISDGIFKLSSKLFLILFTIVFVSAIFNDFQFYFSNNWFYQTQKFIPNESLIPFSVQVDVAKAIVKDANGQKFRLSRIGQGDYFEKNYAQNYIYLLWLHGNEPTPSGKTVYTIHEEGKVLLNNNENELIVDGMVITKNAK